MSALFLGIHLGVKFLGMYMLGFSSFCKQFSKIVTVCLFSVPPTMYEGFVSSKSVYSRLGIIL